MMSSAGGSPRVPTNRRTPEGGQRKPREIRELVIEIAKTTGFEYTRIMASYGNSPKWVRFSRRSPAISSHLPLIREEPDEVQTLSLDEIEIISYVGGLVTGLPGRQPDWHRSQREWDH